MKRRTMIKNVGSTIALSGLGISIGSAQSESNSTGELKGNIHQSVSQWCYGDIPLEDFAQACAEMGIQSIELLQEKDWAVVAKHGLKCAIGYATDYGIPKGFNRLENHEKLIADYVAMIPKAAAAGVPGLICFSGNRDGLSDNDGLINCAIGLRKIMPVAEKHGVNIIMELLNENNHKDYQCSHTSWGAALCEMVGSERFKLLFDIYHMQIMDGNVIYNINKYHRYIGHYHTGGVPGRNEIDDTQELNYPAIMRAIVKTGYTGFVGHEFVPTKKDKLESLLQGVQICDV